MRVVISSGHSRYVRGASGYLEEVVEARRITERVAQYLRDVGVDVVTFHDNESSSQNENLNRIVDFHNAQGPHDLDVSVHLNAYVETSSPMGTEVLYVTQESLADRLSAAIADVVGLPNRGGKYRDDLFFLNNTREKSILIETVFVDSSADAVAYREHYDDICRTIAETISGENVDAPPERPEWPDRPEPPSGALLHVKGACSWFGGPEDHGVDSDEGLAFIYSFGDAPHLFLEDQPSGTTGLARRLDPNVFYIACRWDYDVTDKGMLADQSRKALVRANGREFQAYPADWGPHQDTNRVADLSPALLDALGLLTDDEVEVIYPATAG